MERYNNTWIENFLKDTHIANGIVLTFLPGSMTPVYDLNGTKMSERVKTVFKDKLAPLRRTVNENIFKFSAAKTYQEAVMLNSLLFDRQGNKVPFPKFKQEAEEVLEITNVNYLKTEARTASGNARQILKWEQITAQKETFQFLRYRTVRDKKVRPSHRELDGIVRRVDDDFWVSYMPKNGFNCRCFTEQLERGNETEITDDLITEINKDVPPEWRFNPGIEKKVFGDKHPYWDIPQKHRKLRDENFGFDIPKDKL